jgi:hypothetical protein
MGALHLASIRRQGALQSANWRGKTKIPQTGTSFFFFRETSPETVQEEQKKEDNKTQTKVSESIAGVAHKRVASGVCQHLEGWEMR